MQFGMFGNEEVERLAEFEVSSDRGYEGSPGVYLIRKANPYA